MSDRAGDTKELQPGQIVYQPYETTFYGRVLERVADPKPLEGDDPFTDAFYRILWKDGTENIVGWFYLRSLDGLIADHERKLQTHLNRREKYNKQLDKIQLDKSGESR